MSTREERIRNFGADLIAWLNETIAAAIGERQNNGFTVHYRNKLHCLAGERMEVVPFLNTEKEMPFVIHYLEDIIRMDSKRLKIFMDGYEIDRRDYRGRRHTTNNMKIKLAIFLGVPLNMIQESFTVD